MLRRGRNYSEEGEGAILRREVGMVMKSQAACTVVITFYAVGC